MSRPCFFACLVSLMAALPVLARGGDMAFPDRQWEMAGPESQHVDAGKLKAAVDYLATCGGSNGVKRLVIVRNGQMIWWGTEAEVRQGVWSVSKAFTSTAHGLLIEEGKCSLDTLAKDADPALAKYYPTVTLRHLATMTSGIDAVDGAGVPYDADEKGRGDANALATPRQPFFQTFLRMLGEAILDPVVDTCQRVWQPLTLSFRGPLFSGASFQPDASHITPTWVVGLADPSPVLLVHPLPWMVESRHDGPAHVAMKVKFLVPS